MHDLWHAFPGLDLYYTDLAQQALTTDGSSGTIDGL